MAYGRLIRPHVLAAVPMVNMHFSLLPRWRGAAPVERAILAGDTVTGVCIMDVADELDAGDVYAVAEVPIGDTTTADQLRSRLVDVGTTCSSTCSTGNFPQPTPQSGEVTYAEKLRPEEWRLDWTEPAVALSRWVRAGHAWTTFRGKRLGVLGARLGQLDDPNPVDALTQTAGEAGRRPSGGASPRVPERCSSSQVQPRDGRRCRGPTSPTAPSPAPASGSE